MLQWLREKLARRRERQDDGLFPEPRCPCGRPQPDAERLYCDPCIDMMARSIAADEVEGSG